MKSFAPLLLSIFPSLVLSLTTGYISSPTYAWAPSTNSAYEIIASSPGIHSFTISTLSGQCWVKITCFGAPYNEEINSPIAGTGVWVSADVTSTGPTFKGDITKDTVFDNHCVTPYTGIQYLFAACDEPAS